MAWDYSQSLTASYQDAQLEQRRALLDIDEAHQNEDWYALKDAKNRLRNAEEDANWIVQKAANLQRQQQAAQVNAPNKFGLSRHEQEIAEASFVKRPDLPNFSKEQMQQIYANNKARYWQMRQSGQYRDDQGTVRR